MDKKSDLHLNGTISLSTFLTIDCCQLVAKEYHSTKKIKSFTVMPLFLISLSLVSLLTLSGLIAIAYLFPDQ
jgi:hypothetical protein